MTSAAPHPPPAPHPLPPPLPHPAPATAPANAPTTTRPPPPPPTAPFPSDALRAWPWYPVVVWIDPLESKERARVRRALARKRPHGSGSLSTSATTSTLSSAATSRASSTSSLALASPTSAPSGVPFVPPTAPPRAAAPPPVLPLVTSPTSALPPRPVVSPPAPAAKPTAVTSLSLSSDDLIDIDDLSDVDDDDDDLATGTTRTAGSETARNALAPGAVVGPPAASGGAPRAPRPAGLLDDDDDLDDLDDLDDIPSPASTSSSSSAASSGSSSPVAGVTTLPAPSSSHSPPSSSSSSPSSMCAAGSAVDENPNVRRRQHQLATEPDYDVPAALQRMIDEVPLNADEERLWWPAAVIPVSDIPGDADIAPQAPIGEKELYVRYFEDNTFSIVLEADVQIFTGNDPMYHWFFLRNPAELQRNRGVRRALRFLHEGVAANGFIWRGWRHRCTSHNFSPRISQSESDDDDEDDTPSAPPIGSDPPLPGTVRPRRANSGAPRKPRNADGAVKIKSEPGTGDDLAPARKPAARGRGGRTKAGGARRAGKATVKQQPKPSPAPSRPESTTTTAAAATDDRMDVDPASTALTPPRLPLPPPPLISNPSSSSVVSSTSTAAASSSSGDFAVLLDTTSSSSSSADPCAHAHHHAHAHAHHDDRSSSAGADSATGSANGNRARQISSREVSSLGNFFYVEESKDLPRTRNRRRPKRLDGTVVPPLLGEADGLPEVDGPTPQQFRHHYLPSSSAPSVQPRAKPLHGLASAMAGSRRPKHGGAAQGEDGDGSDDDDDDLSSVPASPDVILLSPTRGARAGSAPLPDTFQLRHDAAGMATPMAIDPAPLPPPSRAARAFSVDPPSPPPTHAHSDPPGSSGRPRPHPLDLSAAAPGLHRSVSHPNLAIFANHTAPAARAPAAGPPPFTAASARAAPAGAPALTSPRKNGGPSLPTSPTATTAAPLSVTSPTSSTFANGRTRKSSLKSMAAANRAAATAAAAATAVAAEETARAVNGDQLANGSPPAPTNGSASAAPGTPRGGAAAVATNGFGTSGPPSATASSNAATATPIVAACAPASNATPTPPVPRITAAQSKARAQLNTVLVKYARANPGQLGELIANSRVLHIAVAPESVRDSDERAATVTALLDRVRSAFKPFSFSPSSATTPALAPTSSPPPTPTGPVSTAAAFITATSVACINDVVDAVMAELRELQHEYQVTRQVAEAAGAGAVAPMHRPPPPSSFSGNHHHHHHLHAPGRRGGNSRAVASHDGSDSEAGSRRRTYAEALDDADAAHAGSGDDADTPGGFAAMHHGRPKRQRKNIDYSVFSMPREASSSPSDGYHAGPASANSKRSSGKTSVAVAAAKAAAAKAAALAAAQAAAAQAQAHAHAAAASHAAAQAHTQALAQAQAQAQAAAAAAAAALRPAAPAAQAPMIVEGGSVPAPIAEVTVASTAIATVAVTVRSGPPLPPPSPQPPPQAAATTTPAQQQQQQQPAPPSSPPSLASVSAAAGMVNS
ncbi:hypothetical protein H9P43_003735 [Blastocladiella emersonii ATCC 22665]|nr:hypothetical protein H9P43_003735 [Blastocladiella emersonii ATCC 22665]